MSLFSRHDWQYKVIKRSKFFDKKWYLKTYQDVADAKMDPIEHYLKEGWLKHHNPSLKFDGDAYLKTYPDVKDAEVNPLLHYEMYGKKEGREITELTNVYSITRTEKIFRFIKRQLARVLYHDSIKNNKNKKILVVLHLFYPESWQVIKYYLKNLEVYNYDLVVSYIKGHGNRKVLRDIKKLHTNTCFLAYQNKGFDIGPFLDIIHKIDISKYDIVFKLHSKGVKRKYIFIYNQIFKNSDWFYNLYNGILGEFSVHKAINAFTKSEKVGLVASKNLVVMDPKHKQFFTHQIAQKYKLKIKQKYNYIAGSCFIIRTTCLNKIKQLGLTINKFENSRRGVFSLAHAMERIVCATVETQGYKIYGISTKHHKYTNELKQAQKTSAIRLLDDKRFVLNNEFFYRSLESKKIIDYQIKKMAIKDIKREWKGKKYNLDQCSPYKYLNGDKKRYITYCAENKKRFKVDMSVNRYDNLITSIETNGFDSKNMPVINAKNNVIMDGQHRSCYLMKKFGPNYKVKALFLYIE